MDATAQFQALAGRGQFERAGGAAGARPGAGAQGLSLFGNSPLAADAAAAAAVSAQAPTSAAMSVSMSEVGAAFPGGAATAEVAAEVAQLTQLAQLRQLQQQRISIGGITSQAQPYVPPAVSGVPAAAAAAPPAAAQPPTKGGLRVMLVVEEPMAAAQIGAMLQQCGFSGTVCSGAFEASATLKQVTAQAALAGTYDLVLADLHMDSGSGEDLLRLIQNDKMSIPTVLMSKHFSQVTIARCVALGAVGFVIKPLRLHDLECLWQYSIRHALQRSTGAVAGAGAGASAAGGLSEGVSVGAGSAGGMGPSEAEVSASKKRKASQEAKRSRTEWKGELEDIFVDAVNKLGIDRATPKQILELMGERGRGIDRGSVGSHLQKYRKKSSIKVERVNKLVDVSVLAVDGDDRDVVDGSGGTAAQGGRGGAGGPGEFGAGGGGGGGSAVSLGGGLGGGQGSASGGQDGGAGDTRDAGRGPEGGHIKDPEEANGRGLAGHQQGEEKEEKGGGGSEGGGSGDGDEEGGGSGGDEKGVKAIDGEGS